jgi:hypothetical protein
MEPPEPSDFEQMSKDDLLEFTMFSEEIDIRRAAGAISFAIALSKNTRLFKIADQNFVIRLMGRVNLPLFGVSLSWADHATSLCSSPSLFFSNAIGLR